jgi:hypothetical protein
VSPLSACAAIWGLAGRRIDAAGGTARFPLERVAAVAAEMRTMLGSSGATTLVCSAACGADLVALRTARDLGLRRRIVLPFAVEVFRVSSVLNRPGDWGPSFDQLIAEARDAGDLVVMDGAPGDAGVYVRANEAILDEVSLLAGDLARAAALIAWDGRPRATEDATHHFALCARRRGMPVCEVLTLGATGGR